MSHDNADHRAIRALIKGQFSALCWRAGQTPDYTPLLDGFVEGARLYPARRPARAQSPRQFCDRLDGLRRDGTLATFAERALGVRIEVFGKVAVAFAACEMVENDTTITRDVSGFLLLEDGGAWRIAAQAWDFERDDLPLPAALAAPGPGGER